MADPSRRPMPERQAAPVTRSGAAPGDNAWHGPTQLAFASGATTLRRRLPGRVSFSDRDVARRDFATALEKTDILRGVWLCADVAMSNVSHVIRL